MIYLRRKVWVVLLFTVLIMGLIYSEPDIPQSSIPKDLNTQIKNHISKLYSFHPIERAQAAYLLGELRIDAVPAIPYLIASLDDNILIKNSSFYNKTDSSQRYYFYITTPGQEAALALRKIGQVPIQVLQKKWTVTPDGSITKKNILFVLCGSDDPSNIDILFQGLKFDYPLVRNCQSALKTIYKKTPKFFIKKFKYYLNSEDSKIRKQTVFLTFVLKDKEQFFGLIAECLKDSDSSVRSMTVWILCEFKANEYLDELLKLFDDPDPNVRRVLADNISKFKDPKVFEMLLKILEVEKDPYVLKEAASSLTSFQDIRKKEPLLKLFNHPNLKVQKSAIYGIGNIYDEDIRKALLRKFDRGVLYPKEYNIVIESVIFRLGMRHDPENIIPILNVLKYNVDYSICESVSNVFYDIPNDVAPIIVERFTEFHSNNQRTLVRIIQRTRDPKYIDFMVSIFDLPDKNTHLIARDFLILFQEQAIPEIIKMLSSSNPFKKKNGVLIALRMKIPQTFELSKLLYDINDIEIRKQIAENLSYHPFIKTYPIYKHLLNDPHYSVRRAARNSMMYSIKDKSFLKDSSKDTREKYIELIRPMLSYENIKDEYGIFYRIGDNNLHELAPDLILLLKHENPGIREKSSRALINLKFNEVSKNAREKYIELLRPLLSYENVKDEYSIFHLIKAADLHELIPELILLLKHENSGIRIKSVKTLGSFKVKEALEPLKKLLDDPDKKVKNAAKDSIQFIKVSSLEITDNLKKENVNKLILSTYSKDNRINQTAEKKLKNLKIALKDLPWLEKNLRNPDPKIRKGTISLLMRIRSKTDIIPILIPILDDEDLDVRITVVKKLCYLNDKRTIKPLLKKIKDKKLRPHISFSNFSSYRKRIIDKELIHLLNDPDPEIRSFAARKIRTKLSAPYLIKHINDPVLSVRLSIISSLGYCHAYEAFPALIQALEDPNHEIRKSAISSLTILMPSGAVDPLGKLVYDPSEEIRSGVAYALSRSTSQKAIKYLLILTKDSSLDVRRAAFRGLLKQNDDQYIELMMKEVSDPDSRINCQFNEYFYSRGSKENVEKFKKINPNYHPDSTAYKLLIVGQYEEEKNYEMVIKYLKRKNRLIKKRAIEALGNIGDPEAVPLLKPFLNKEDLKLSAIEALEKINTWDAINAIVDVFEKDDIWSVFYARASLVRIGEPAIEIVNKRFDQYNLNKCEAALYMAAKVECIESLKLLMKGLRHSNVEVRRYTSKQIKCEKYILLQIMALYDSDSKVKISSLINIRKNKPENCAKYITHLLNDSNPEVIEEAIDTLIELNATETLPKLRGMINHKNLDIQCSVIKALGKFKDEESLEVLIKFLESENDEIIMSTLWSLSQFANQQSIDSLERFISRTENHKLKKEALELIGKIKDPQIPGIIFPYLREGNKKLRRIIICGLRNQIGPEPGKMLVDQLKIEKDPKLSMLIIDTLIALKYKPAIKEVRKRLSDQNGDVQGYAAYFLGEMGDTESVPEMNKLMETLENDGAVNLSAALGILKDERSLDIMKKMLYHPNWLVRNNAAFFLRTFPEKDVLDKVIELTQFSTYKKLRVNALLTLCEYNDKKIIPYLIEGIGEYAQDVDDKCITQLKVLTNQDFGKDKQAWQTWYENQK